MALFHVQVFHEGRVAWDHDSFDLPGPSEPPWADASPPHESWTDAPLAVQGRPQATAVIADEAVARLPLEDPLRNPGQFSEGSSGIWRRYLPSI
jgi:hypothetical protein